MNPIALDILYNFSVNAMKMRSEEVNIKGNSASGRPIIIDIFDNKFNIQVLSKLFDLHKDNSLFIGRDIRFMSGFISQHSQHSKQIFAANILSKSQDTFRGLRFKDIEWIFIDGLMTYNSIFFMMNDIIASLDNKNKIFKSVVIIGS